MSGGSPGTTEVRSTPGTRDPGYGYARDLFNSLGGIANSPYPSYQGNIDPGMSPTMQNAIRMIQGYAGTTPPEILSGVQGNLGKFMSPQFQNPMARVGQGYPNYFPINPQQPVWGGGTVQDLGAGGGMSLPPGDAGGWASLLNIDPGSGVAKDLGQIFSAPGARPRGGVMNPPGQMGKPGQTTRPMEPGGPGWQTKPYGPMEPGTPGWNQKPDYGYDGGYSQKPYQPGGNDWWGQMFGNPGLSNDGQMYLNNPGGRAPQLSNPMVPAPQSSTTTDPIVAKWLQDNGIAPTVGAGGLPQFSTQMQGVKTHHDMGAGANRGEMRRDPVTGQTQIYMGTGQGGDTYSWQAYDPNNYGHVQNAAMFQRYGKNWTSGGGGGGAGGHSTDVRAELEAQLGRAPTEFEVQDAMYGVRPGGFSYTTQPMPQTPTPGAPPPGGGTAPPPPGGNIHTGAAPGVPAWMKPRPGETPQQLQARYAAWLARTKPPTPTPTPRPPQAGPATPGPGSATKPLQTGPPPPGSVTPPAGGMKATPPAQTPGPPPPAQWTPPKKYSFGSWG